jgi:predicted HicB family RNase H-like nuclease
MSDKNFNAGMKRVGRPATGHQPRLSVRMDPSMLKLAAQCAKAKGHTIGKWLEEAITEKREREQGAEDVTKADC